MRKLLLFTVGFSICCLLYTLQPDFSFLPRLAFFVLAAVLGTVWVRPLRRRCAAVTLGLFVGLIWCFSYGLLVSKPAENLTGKNLRLTGEVSAYSRQSERGVSVELSLTDGEASARASVFLYGAKEQLAPGDRIEGSFTLSPVSASVSGDQLLHSNASGVVLTGYGKLTAVIPCEKFPLRYLPKKLARSLREALLRLPDEKVSAFLIALITGDRSLLSAGVRNDMSVAGVSHVIAISGMHVSILIAFLCLFTGKMNLPAALAGIPTVILFALMTGGSPSIVRAAVMQILILVAPLLGREDDVPTSMSAAALLILGADPRAILNISFLLSFCAVAGIFAVTGPLNSYLTHIRPAKAIFGWKGKGRFSGFLATRLHRLYLFAASSVSATIGGLIFTAPVIALAFGTFPIYAMLTNALILWVISFCFSGGLLVAILLLLIPSLSGILGLMIGLPVRYVLWICHLIAGFPSAILPTGTIFGISFLASAYLTVGVAVLIREKRLFRPMAVVLACLVLCVIGARSDFRSHRFRIAAVDVGEGQCISLIMPDYTAVIDCGGESSSGQSAVDYLRQAGSERIDALILTHYDTDHINGAAYLLSAFQVKTVYLPDVPFDPNNRALVERAAAECGAELRYVRSDQIIPVKNGALQLFAPVSEDDDNAASLSIYARIEDYSFLITGDQNDTAEQALISTHSIPPVDLFIAGHHGSKSSSCSALLEKIRPKTVLISVGANRYGQPAPETLERFRQIGAEVYRTDQCGVIEIGR